MEQVRETDSQPAAGTRAHGRGPAAGAEIGGPIAASFGLVFVIVNSAALPGALRVGLIAVAALVAVAIIVLSLRLMRRWGGRGSGAGRGAASGLGGPADDPRGRSPFGAAFWIIVAVEPFLIVVGTRIVTGLFGDEFGVAWIALVVGVHFLPFARIFGLRRFLAMGAAIAALGVIGFCLGFSGWEAAIAVVSGVGSGAVLLAFGLWGVLQRRR